MSTSTPPEKTAEEKNSTSFAPKDLTDGRKPLEWQTKYIAAEAKRQISIETAYIVAVLICYLGALFCLLPSAIAGPASGESPATVQTYQYLCYRLVWIGGSIGGTLFTMKWLYHGVAKGSWHQDRLLWRLLTPHMSGAVSLFMFFTLSAGLINFTKIDLTHAHAGVLSFSFLMGYCSDKAIAKLSDITDALLGSAK